MKHFFPLSLFFVLHALTSCRPDTATSESSDFSGLWRGSLQIQGHELPFHFRLSGPSVDSLEFIFINGKEELSAGLLQREGDSLRLSMEEYDSEIRVALPENNSLRGRWIKRGKDNYHLPFQARKGESVRFDISREDPSIDLNGRWTVQFTGENAADTSRAAANFLQTKNSLMGSFITDEGDYNHLEGNVSGSTPYLSAFNGREAYLFRAEAIGPDRLEGIFWRGKLWEKKWKATRDSSTATREETLTTQ